MAKQKLKVSDDIGRLKNSSLIDCTYAVRKLADKIADEEIAGSDNSKTKKEYFLKIANQLELDGKSKEKISKITLLIIEERLALKLQKENIPTEQAKLSISTIRHLSRTMEQAGYTNPFYSRNKKDKDPKNIPKGFALENELWIEQINLIEMFCRKFKDYLKNNSFDGGIPIDEKTETLQIFNALIEDSLESINNKTKIQKYHQYLLYETFTIIGMNNLASKYSVKFKECQNTTAKQLRKILAGRCSTLLDIFNPKTTYESTKLGFSGLLCSNCKSLRTVFDEVKDNGKTKVKIYCYVCHKHSVRPETKLPKPNLIANGYRDPHP